MPSLGRCTTTASAPPQEHGRNPQIEWTDNAHRTERRNGGTAPIARSFLLGGILRLSPGARLRRQATGTAFPATRIGFLAARTSFPAPLSSAPRPLSSVPRPLSALGAPVCADGRPRFGLAAPVPADGKPGCRMGLPLARSHRPSRQTGRASVTSAPPVFPPFGLFVLSQSAEPQTLKPNTETNKTTHHYGCQKRFRPRLRKEPARLG